MADQLQETLNSLKHLHHKVDALCRHLGLSALIVHPGSCWTSSLAPVEAKTITSDDLDNDAIIKAEVDAAMVGIDCGSIGTNETPETPPDPNPTLADLRTVFRQASRAGHKEALLACLEMHNAKKLPDLQEDDYKTVFAYAQGLITT